MKMEEKGHALLFSFLLFTGENVGAMAGAPAAILSHEITGRMETIAVKTTKQTNKRKRSLDSSDTI